MSSNPREHSSNRLHLVEATERVSALAQENTLLSHALQAVQQGDLALAERLLAAATQSKLTLHEVFALYQAELQTREEELRQSQQRVELSLDWFANLFRTLPVAAVLVDAQGMIADANEFGVEALGLTRVLNRLAVPLRRLLTTPEDELRLFELLAQVENGESGSMDELPLRTLEGQPLWVDLRANRVPPRTLGSSAMTLCVFNDRTARVEAQRARELAAQAEHQRDLALSASNAKTLLLSRVSHELRTPLNAVLGFSQLMLMDPLKLDADSKRKVELIADAGKHLLALVNDVLEINQAESGQLALSREAINLRQLVCEVLALQEPMALAMKVTLTPPHSAIESETPVQSFADARRLHQILTNLVSNAIKYNRIGGWVEVCIGVDADQPWIEVTDSGRGMTPEQLTHLFEPFNRLGAERLKIAGTGLGLSIARTMTELMGGTLTARSQPDEGTSFTLRLPRATTNPVTGGTNLA
ncbi:MAG: sensor histidine kinase [Burkholderiaceae bacterium]